MARLDTPGANVDLSAYPTIAYLAANHYVTWDPVNSNLLDGATVISGLLTVNNYTDLPSAASSNNKSYAVLLPTPAVYYSNGTNWYQVGGNVPTYTWANFPAANTMVAGTVLRIDPSSFGGTYKSSLGIFMVTDGTNWKPQGGCQLMASMSSTVASPAVTGTGTGAEAMFTTGIATNFSMPAGLLSYLGIGVRIQAYFMKTGADALASTYRVKMGKNNTVGTSDIIYSGTTTAVALREVKVYQEARVTALGANTVAKFTTDTNQPNAQGTNLANDKTTYLDTTAINYVVFTQNGTVTTSTHALLSFSIELLA